MNRLWGAIGRDAVRLVAQRRFSLQPFGSPVGDCLCHSSVGQIDVRVRPLPFGGLGHVRNGVSNRLPSLVGQLPDGWALRLSANRKVLFIRRLHGMKITFR